MLTPNDILAARRAQLDDARKIGIARLRTLRQQAAALERQLVAIDSAIQENTLYRERLAAADLPVIDLTNQSRKEA